MKLHSNIHLPEVCCIKSFLQSHAAVADEMMMMISYCEVVNVNCCQMTSSKMFDSWHLKQKIDHNCLSK